jgi:hypothetical protein
VRQAWKSAAEAYEQLAAVQTKLDSKHDAASSYVEGAKAIMKVSPAAAVPLLQQVRGKVVALWNNRGCAATAPSRVHAWVCRV